LKDKMNQYDVIITDSSDPDGIVIQKWGWGLKA
jgi:spermidine synthase